MMFRIAYFVHGRGRGHAARARQTLPRLRDAGFSLRVFAAADALALLEDVPELQPVARCAPGRGMARAFVARVRSDRRALRAMGADLVISDGDGPSVHAALSLDLPSVAVGHGLIFRHCELPITVSRGVGLREQLNAASSSWPSVRRVAVHFAPLNARTKGTLVARPDLQPELTGSRTPENCLLAYFRDANGSAVLERLVARGHRVVCFGKPGPKVTGVDYEPTSAPRFASMLMRARGVVGSAGNHLPAECAMVGVPMLAVHRVGDSEQQVNAALIEHAGIGLGRALSEIDDETLTAFEARLDHVDEALRRATRALPAASEAITRQVAETVRAAGTGARRRWRRAST